MNPTGWVDALVDRMGAKKATDLIVTLAIRVPRWTVCTLGIAGVGVGLQFLTLGDRFEKAVSLQILLDTMPATGWGIVFLIAGVSLATTAIVDHTKAHSLCVLMAVLFCTFGALAAAGAVRGSTTMVTPWLSIIIGWLCVFNAITTKAYPHLKEKLRDATARAQKP